MQHYQNILIVRTDRIGDVILTTPSMAALRQAYPQTRLTMMVTPQTCELVEENPYLNEVVVYDPKKLHRGFFGFWRFILGLRKKNFDLAIIFHTKKRTNLICFLAGIPHRIGYTNNKFGFLLTQGITDTRPEGKKHEAEYCLDVLRHIGVEAKDLKLYIPLKKESEEWVNDFLKEKNIFHGFKLIAVHPDASCVSKRWPVGKFIELIRNLLQWDKVAIIIVGGPESQTIAKDIKTVFGDVVIDLTGKISLSQLASLLKRCALLISNDSGPVHIAAALGTSVISIFGRNQAGLSPTRWRPLGMRDIVLHKEVGCEICLAHNCMIGFECLEAISPKEVLEAADTLLSKSA